MSSVVNKIPEGWVEATLENLTVKIGSGATPRGGADSYKEQGISLIRSQNILDFDFSYNGLAFIDETQARKLSNVKLEQNDVLINITGDSVARVCMVPYQVLPARVNQHVAIIRANPQKLDNHFLLYYLLDSNFKRFLLQIASNGATRNALTKSDLECLLIKTPIDLKEQKAIAQILIAFDDKIENLRAQNQTLEILAQTIFKEWFGKHQVGNVLPDGWRQDKMAAFFDYKEGPGIRNWQYTESGNRFINIRLIKDGDLKVENANFVSLEEANGKYSHFQLKEKDYVLSTSGTLGRGAIVRKEHLPLLLNTSVIRFRPIDKFSFCYTYLFLQSKYFLHELSSLASGSVQLNFGPMHLEQIDCIIPSKIVLREFAELVNPLYDKLIINYSQIQTLTQTRDTLLPKLMTGQLRVNKFTQ